jgi:hypothetical protein
MKPAKVLFRATENPLENDDRRVGRRPWIIESAGEPESEIGPTIIDFRDYSQFSMSRIGLSRAFAK